ncbi:selina-4(15),7(11)-diene synthase [Streptomyces sp. NPDC055078]
MTVPSLFSPIPPAIHPRHAAVDARTAVWAEAFGIGSQELRGRLVRHELGTFSARILPEGDEEVVSILSDFCLWLFGLDDGYCEEGDIGHRPGDLAAFLHRLLRIAQNPEVPLLENDPLAEGLRDLRARIARYGTDGQAARWVDALREYFFSVVWEAEHRRTDTVPDLNDYTLMRLYDGATTLVLPLLEIAHGYELQPHERDLPAVRAAGEMTSFITTWDNDMFSYHKESTHSGYFLNVLRVLEQRHGHTPEDALATVVNHRDRVLCLFLRLHETLTATGSPQLRTYMNSLAHFIRANQDWGTSSVRYTGHHDPADLPTTFSDTPTDDSETPLDIPVITWWWDLVPATKGQGTRGPAVPRAYEVTSLAAGLTNGRTPQTAPA